MSRIVMRHDVIINKPAVEVFRFTSDTMNDHLWRSEVAKMDVKGDLALGTEMTEYATFFRFFHTEATTTIVKLDPPKQIVVETKPGDVWLKCLREVESLGESQSRYTYELSFDAQLLKQVTPILPPAFMVKLFYGAIIDNNMKKARRVIEAL
ncbi:MAG: hypothetical protein RLP44_20250 [Aggregatilineales bacterium]